jgi:hypothetical protein
VFLPISPSDNMSALIDGNFQNHYAMLEVDQQSVSETIQQAYAKLAQKYNSRNSTTGDAEMFKAVNLAYEVLSNPERRKEFDKLHGISQEGGSPKFSGLAFFDALGHEAVLRAAILCLLYDRRRTRPSAPGLSTRQVEVMVEATAVELSAALWYLKQRGLVLSDDKSSLQITVEGMDFLLRDRPLPEDVMGFIKPGAMAFSQVQAPRARKDPPPSAKHEGESVLSAINQALVRGSV